MLLIWEADFPANQHGARKTARNRLPGYSVGGGSPDIGSFFILEQALAQIFGIGMDIDTNTSIGAFLVACV